MNQKEINELKRAYIEARNLALTRRVPKYQKKLQEAKEAYYKAQGDFWRLKK